MRHFFKVADIEDMHKARNIPKLTTSATQFNIAKPPKVAAVPPPEELKIENCPSPDEDFPEWLKFQKSNWRRIRKDLKAERNVAQGASSVTGLQMNKALSNFMRLQDNTVLNSNWHIMQIEPTYEPGELRIWALTEQGSMFNVKLAISKLIYINSKVASETLTDFKKVQKTLPRNRKSHMLYEWESPEERFLEKFNNIKQ